MMPQPMVAIDRESLRGGNTYFLVDLVVMSESDLDANDCSALVVAQHPMM